MKKKTIALIVVISVLCFSYSCQKKSSSLESTSSADKAEPSQAVPESEPASPQNLNEDLVAAAWSDDSGEIQRLLKAGAEINAKDGFGFTALMRASERGNAELVKALLQAGADIKVKRENGWTALQDACSANQLEALKVLLDAGADPNERGTDGTGILLWAVGYGYTEVVRELVKAGTRIDDPIDRFGQTPLMQAARTGKTEIIRTVLELGAKINAKDREGKTALDYAKENGHAEIAEILNQAGGKD
ncbi:MAG: ankyrin repeat domain-containing protein [Acidobacteriota bacterium]|nr:ankyrin repeat domain-containing protein [Acidobacteriota bacterium]